MFAPCSQFLFVPPELGMALKLQTICKPLTKKPSSPKISYEAEADIFENPASRNRPFRVLPTYGLPPFAICISLNRRNAS